MTQTSEEPVKCSTTNPQKQVEKSACMLRLFPMQINLFQEFSKLKLIN